LTLAEVLAGATGYLAERGVESPRLDAERLAARALGLSRIELYTQHDRPLMEGERTAVRELVAHLAVAQALTVLIAGQQQRREDVVAGFQVRVVAAPGDLGQQDLVDRAPIGVTHLAAVENSHARTLVV
jgi:hypothetical protein